jgi:hypothetical protein
MKQPSINHQTRRIARAIGAPPARHDLVVEHDRMVSLAT